MRSYDERMIAGCTVYSYTVECPVRTKKGKRTSKRSANISLKKLLLAVLFTVLAPFAILLDGLFAAVAHLSRSITANDRRRAAITNVLGVASSFILFSTLLMLVLL